MGRGRQTAPYDVPQCMVFEPSLEEIQDFQGYMEYMEQKGAHLAGIAKIILPEGWTPRKAGYALETIKDMIIKRPIKQTFTNVGDDKRAFQTKSSSRGPMTIQEYYDLSQSHTYRTPPHKSHEDLERKYWKSLSFVPPIYGADITDSITDPDCKHFNVAKLQSILNYVNEDQNESYAGVTTPYLYMGSWKTTFSWHVEDMDLYAINYLHFGMPKTWYCVPPKYGHLLEKACRTLFPNVANWCSNFMRHKTCLINPSLLDELGVPYQKVVQEERNAIIVYPYAYHSGFNHGFNCAESTNFALERWVEYGKRYRPCDCSSNNVKINMDCFVKRFQPQIYEKWVAGKDIGPHPEDPPDVVALIRLKVENPEAYASLMAEKIQKEAEKSSEKLPFYTSTGRNLAVFKTTLRFVKGDSIVLNEVEKKEFELWKQEQRNNSKIIFQEAGGPIVSADRRLVHVYQHVELTQLKIKVLPRTLTVIGDGLNLLKQSLPNERFQSVKELIDRGTLLKIGERQMKRKRNFKKEMTQASTSNELSIKRKVTEKVIHELKHTYMDLKAFVFAENPNEYYGRQTDALTTYMDNSDMNLMIQNGLFAKTREFKVLVEEDKPNIEKKVEELEKKQESIEKKAIVKIDENVNQDFMNECEYFSIFYNNETENYIALNPVTFATPKIEQEVLNLSPGQTLNDLIQSNKLKLIQHNKKFKKGVQYKCILTPVKVYHHIQLGLDFYMTKTTPSKPFNVGRMKKSTMELKDILKSNELSKLEANRSVVYKEDITICRFQPRGEGRKRIVRAQMSVKKYYFSNDSLVEVDVVRRLDRLLFRLPMGNGKEALLQLLIKNDLEDLIKKGLLKEIPQNSPPEELSRLEGIIKCELVPKKLYKFSVQGHPNRNVWSNATQSEIVGRLPDELKFIQRSSLGNLIQEGVLHDGVEDYCYLGETLLKKAIFKSNLGELSIKDYEISHLSHGVHLAKNHREKELFLMKRARSFLGEEDEEEAPPSSSEQVPISLATTPPVSNEELIIREDEEVDEEDYDDLEESEDEMIIPEVEEFSEDEKVRNQSDEEGYSTSDPDYKINQPYKYRPSPCLKRKKRGAASTRSTTGSTKAKGRPKGSFKRTKKTSPASQSQFHPQDILDGLENCDTLVPHLDHVLEVLESSNIIEKNGETYVSSVEDLQDKIREKLRRHSSTSPQDFKAKIHELLSDL